MLQNFLDWLFGEDESNKTKKNKVFISFAIEDKKFRDFLVSQSRNSKTPFSLIDMSVKEPWPEKEWKRQCRLKIRQCDCMIVLLSKNTWHSSGTRWEIKCGREERIRMIGVHIKKEDKGAIPPELYGKKIIEWSWKGLEKFLN